MEHIVNEIINKLAFKLTAHNVPFWAGQLRAVHCSHLSHHASQLRLQSQLFSVFLF